MARKHLLGLFCLVLLSSVGFGVDFSSAAYDCAPNHSVFVTGFQRFARLKNDDGVASTRYNPTAGALGYLYNQNSWYAGGALSYEHGTRKYDLWNSDVDYKVRSNMPGMSLFGGFETPDGWYLDTAAYMGFGDYKAKDVRGVGLTGNGNKFHENAYAASIEGGKQFNLGSFLLTPHVGIDYAYTEGESHIFGANARRNVDSQNYLEIPLGVSFSKVFDYNNWSIMPKVDLTMVNSIGDMDTMNDQPGFTYRTAKSWKVAGVGGDNIGGRITAGVAAKVNDRTTMGLDYTYEGRKDYNDHRISAMIGLSF